MKTFEGQEVGDAPCKPKICDEDDDYFTILDRPPPITWCLSCVVLVADYMTNFSPPVSRAEISAPPLEQILKRRL